MGVSFDSVPAAYAASARFIEQAPERRSRAAAKLPQRLTFPAQYNSGLAKAPVANVPVQILSLGDIQTRAGRGSMAALIYDAIRRVWDGDIFWIPLDDAAGGVVATKSITIATAASSAGTKSFLIGGRKVSFAVASGDTANTQATALAAAITADLDNPFTAAAAAAVVTLTARNKGLAPHRLAIIADPDLGDATAAPGGTTYTIANATAGTTDPTLDTALANLGGAAHTVLVNPYGGTASEGIAQCASFETAFNARIDPAVKRPFASFMGYVDTLANYNAFLATRNHPATTVIPVEGSPCPAWEIAATAAAVWAKSNEAHPGAPCNGRVLPGIRGDASKPIWTGAQRHTIAVAGGSWTMLMPDGTVQLGDMVTTYKSNSQGVLDAADKWRYTDTIANMQAKLYSIDYLISGDRYARAVVVDDSSPSSAAHVIRPKTLKADLVALVDSWVLEGWSKDRAAIVAGIVVEINPTNAGRLDFYIPDVMSAGLRIIAGRYGWSFFSA